MPNLVGIGNSQVPTNAMLGGLAYQDSSVLDQVRSGRKNMIINGDMRICQRYAVNTANNINNSTHTYHVDRFKAYESTHGILQGEWENDNYSDAGFQYSVKYTPATADTSLGTSEFAFISQVIEMENMRHLAYGLSYAKTCTLSFYVKSNLTGTYSISLLNDGTNNRQFVTEYQINNSNTWERKTITIPGDTSGTWNSTGLRIAWNLAVSSDRQASTVGSWFGDSTARYGTDSQINFMNNTSYTFNLTGVQFEIGESATDFEHRSYGEELQLCQRYYQVHDGHYFQVVSPSTGANADFYVNLPYWVPMNHGPDVTQSYSLSGATTNNLVSVTKTKAKFSLRPTTANSEIYVSANTLRLDAEL